MAGSRQRAFAPGDFPLGTMEGYANDAWAWCFLTAFLAMMYGYDDARAVVLAVQCGGDS